MVHRHYTVIFTLFLSAGCAELSTYHHVDSPDDKSQVISVDAKQRVIISAQGPLDRRGNTVTQISTVNQKSNEINEKTVSKDSATSQQSNRIIGNNIYVSTGSKNSDTWIRRFCAEPSPDALSAFSSTLGFGVFSPAKGDINLNQAFSEGTANIGTRTAAIQALRDITYRNCESYLNGGITGFGLETLQRRFQSTIVASLAIEALAGANRAPNVVIKGATFGNDAASLAKINDQVDNAKTASDNASKERDDADKVAANAQKAMDDLVKKQADDKAKIAAIKKKSPDSLTQEEKDALAAYEDLGKNQIPKAKNTLVAAKQVQDARAQAATKSQENYEAVRKSRDKAMTAPGSTGTTADVPTELPHRTLDKDTTEVLGKAITEIVGKTLELGFGREVCTTLFGQMASDQQAGLIVAKDTNSLMGACIDYLWSDSKLLNTTAEIIDTAAKFAADKNNSEASRKEILMQLLNHAPPTNSTAVPFKAVEKSKQE